MPGVAQIKLLLNLRNLSTTGGRAGGLGGAEPPKSKIRGAEPPKSKIRGGRTLHYCPGSI